MSGDDLLAEIHRGIGELNGKFDSMREEHRRHSETIYGNGKPGLVTRLSSAEEKISEMRGTEHDARTAKVSAKTSLAGAIVTALLGLIAASLGIGGAKSLPPVQSAPQNVPADNNDQGNHRVDGDAIHNETPVSV